MNHEALKFSSDGSALARRVLHSLGAIAIVAMGVGCQSSMARVASAPDVASCRPLGDVTANVPAGSATDAAARRAALRKEAARAGATDVVVADDPNATTGAVVHGQMYACNSSKGDDTEDNPQAERTGF